MKVEGFTDKDAIVTVDDKKDVVPEGGKIILKPGAKCYTSSLSISYVARSTRDGRCYVI